MKAVTRARPGRLKRLQIGNDILGGLSKFVMDPAFQEQHKLSSSDFTQKSPLGFDTLFWLLCKTRPKTMAMELHEAAEQDGVVNRKGNAISGCAFSKRCKLIKPSALKEAHRWFYERMLESELGRFYGTARRRLLAVDGTMLWMTGALKHQLELDRIRNRTADDPEVDDRDDRPCQFRGVILHDVLNDCVVDVAYDLEDIGERQLAIDTLRRSVRPCDILLFDRGYPAAWLVKLIRKLGADCVIRMIVDPRRPEVMVALSADQSSTEFQWGISSRDKKWLKKSGMEYVRGDFEALRCVRGESSKEGVMLLATTLAAADFDDARICDFYRQRWSVEIVIGRLKGIRDFEAWSGRSLHRLELDLWGAVLGDAIESFRARLAQLEVEAAEREREERRVNPPPKPPPGRPPKPLGTTRKYHPNKLNRKQFHTMFTPLFLKLTRDDN